MCVLYIVCIYIYIHIYICNIFVIYIYIFGWYINIYIYKSCLTQLAWLQTYAIDKAVLDTKTLHIFQIFESCEDFIICNLYICSYINIILITEEFFKVAIYVYIYVSMYTIYYVYYIYIDMSIVYIHNIDTYTYI